MQYALKSDDEVIQTALSIMEARAHQGGDGLSNPKLAGNLFMLRLGNLEHEVFCVAFLDNQNRLIAAEDMFRGTIDGASVYPREVVKRALQLNASAVMFAHNHPSGNVTPSTADRQITKRLKEALALIDIRVLDHIVVTAVEYISFAEQGWL